MPPPPPRFFRSVSALRRWLDERGAVQAISAENYLCWRQSSYSGLGRSDRDGVAGGISGRRRQEKVAPGKV